MNSTLSQTLADTEFDQLNEFANWSQILDEEQFGALIPILALFHEHDPDPGLRSESISAAQREELLIDLAAGAMRVYRYLEPHRKMAARLVNSKCCGHPFMG